MAGIEETYPAFAPRITKAREAGFSDIEINDEIKGRIREATNAGFSVAEIQKEVGGVGFFEGLKRAGSAGVQELGRTLLQSYKSLDPDQAGSMLESGMAPLLAPLIASPPGAASIAVGEATRTGAEQLGASPNLQAGLATVADFAVPGAFIPKMVRGATAKAARPAQRIAPAAPAPTPPIQRTVSELLQNERAKGFQEGVAVAKQAPDMAPVPRDVPPPAAPAAQVAPQTVIPEPRPPEPAPVAVQSIEDRIRALEVQNAELRAKQPQPQVTPKPPDTPIIEAQPSQIAPEVAKVEPKPVRNLAEMIAEGKARAEAKRAEPPKPMRTPQQAVKFAADEHIRTIVDTPADLEYKGKTYTGAERIPGNNVRLKDDPDKVVRGTNQILQVEEKIPFDIPPERPSIQQTPAGAQAMIPGAEGRSVPKAPLKPKRPQTETPMELEQPGIRAKEPSLLDDQGITRLYRVDQARSRGVPEWTKVDPSPGQQSAFVDVPNNRVASYIDEPVKQGQTIPSNRAKPIPSKNVSPDEIAAADEMRGMLGGKKQGRTVKEILGSEEGSVRLGPLRIRDGKPVEAPTVGEVKEAVEQIKRPSSTRLTAGGLGEESTKTLTKTMGEEGGTLGRLSKAVRNDSEIEAGVARLPVKKAIQTLEGAERRNFVDVLGGEASPMNETVREAAAVGREALDKAGDRASEVRLEITLPSGEKIPFHKRGYYFPHIGGKSLGQRVKDPRERANIKAKLKAQMERGGKVVKDSQVEAALKSALKKSQTRYGNLEIARVFDSDDWVKEPEMLLKYLDDAYWRIHIAEKFGPDLEKGEKLLTAIGAKKGDEAEGFARSYFKKATFTEDPGNPVVKKAIDVTTNFQAGSKLGQAVLSNVSQPVYTAVVAGAKNTVKGYYKFFTKEGKDFGTKIIGDSWADFMKDTGGISPDDIASKFADAVLTNTQFNYIERMNRIVSANAGRYFAVETLEKLIKNPENKTLRRALEKMNINVDDAIGRGKLTELEQLRAGQSIVNRTQFKTDVTEIPLFWSSNPGRLITQFKKFQFKSGQMVKDEILAEMAKGNVKPFLRAAALFPPAGFAVAKLRDSIRFGQQTEEERNLADYLAMVGTFGAFTDAFASSSKWPVRGLQYLAGPTLGDAGLAWEAAAGLTGYVPGGVEGKWRPAAKLLSRQIPVVGPSIRQLFNEEKARKSGRRTERKGREARN